MTNDIKIYIDKASIVVLPFYFPSLCLSVARAVSCCCAAAAEGRALVYLPPAAPPCAGRVPARPTGWAAGLSDGRIRVFFCDSFLLLRGGRSLTLHSVEEAAVPLAGLEIGLPKLGRVRALGGAAVWGPEPVVEG